jgi:mRNA interferase YafQ
MKYSLEYETSFKSDFKKCVKRNLNMKLFEDVLFMLSENGKLPPKYKTHSLKGNFKGYLECHIQMDWLLIWKQDDSNKIIKITRMGKHDDLF